MKKYLLMFLISFSVLFTKVDAKTIFVYDWGTTPHNSTVSYYRPGYNNSSANYEFSYLLYNNYSEYLDGYVVSEEIYDDSNDSWETVVIYYSKDGKILKQFNEYDFTIDDLVVYNDSVYVLAFDSNTNYYYIVKLDNELEVEKKARLTGYSKNWPIYMRKYYGIDMMMVDGTNIVVYGGYNATVIDAEIVNETYAAATSFDLLKLDSMRYNVLMGLFGNYKGGKTAYVSANSVSNDELLLSGAYYKEECLTNNEDDGIPCITSQIISSFNKNNEMNWSFLNDKYTGITDVSYVGDYLVGIATKYDGNNNIINLISVLDDKGNVLQEIIYDNNLIMLEPTTEGFMVLTYKDKDEEDLINYNVDVYVFGYDILTKTDGNGKIIVDESAKLGEIVSYEIIPDTNYVVDKVIVKDEQGNVISTNNNSFLMPDTDVIIEVTFTVENPNTNDFKIISIAILFVLLIGITISNYKRLKWLQ